MMGKIILIALAALWCGCSTIRPAPSPVPGALEYRETQAEIRQQQAELAVTGVKLAEGSQGMTEGIIRLEESIVRAPQDPGEADRLNWLHQARELRARAEEHQGETEKLNQQLAEERETTRRQGEIFDQREEAWQTAVSDREAENAALKMDNQKLAGQRNTFLAILLTAAGIILIIIVVKVIRVLKIIPF
jgi:hypothetical protein